MIVGVGIRQQDGTVTSLPRPSRHHNLLALLADAGQPLPIRGEQGFVDENAKFYTRKEATLAALASGQCEALRWPPDIYSEDLW